MPAEAAARHVRAPGVAPAELPEEDAHFADRDARGPNGVAARAPRASGAPRRREPDMHDFEEELARTVRPLRNDAERNSALHELQAAAMGGVAARAAVPHGAPGDDGRSTAAARQAAPEWPRAGPEPAERRPVREPAPAPAREDGARRRDLLSPGVDAAVAAAFQSLGDVVLPHKERTVEDLVKEILRPMLKDWLDQHLPGIVEGLVRAEIERVTRQPR